ncbi:MAG: RNA 2'-phosphotransferase [Lachnospiraceae bacterium]|nr:RNA 2'-phosphotransferase [Lachnospiraceae bacterium]
MSKSLTELSKFISLILRHKPSAANIELDEYGWANVDELIAGINEVDSKNSIDMEKLEEIVRTDNKQRYSFNEDRTLIRANQGHSIPVDVKLEEVEPPEYLWHGTGQKYMESIDNEGLVPKSRLYVHLSGDEETAINVGKRHGKLLMYKVLSGKMQNDGYKFYRSVNGVWLTKTVPAEYLEKQE